MQVTATKKKASPVVWIIVAVMVIALLALIVFYAYQEEPSERLPTDHKGNESSKIIYLHEVWWIPDLGYESPSHRKDC